MSKEAVQEIEHLVTLSSATFGYTIRSEVHQGRPHIVVPVIMMVEGVHAGSAGALLHLAEDLGRFPAAWNGIPISVQHPSEDGVLVSANQPHMIDEAAVGRVFEAEMDGPRLRAEAWLDEQRLAEVSPEALEYIRKGRPLEVSIGVFTEEELAPGEFNGVEYIAIARNHRPDHLALLPGGQGACSWADGCGIRANLRKEGGDLNVTNLVEVMKQLSGEGYCVIQINEHEQGFREVMQIIQTKLDRMDDDLKVHFLTEVFEDHFVYEIRGRDGTMAEPSLWRRSYTVNADDSIEFTGEPEPVRRQIEFVVLSELNANDGKEVKTMGDDKKTEEEGTEEAPKKKEEVKVSCACPEKVTALIQCDRTRFGEGDREWLETLEEGRIDSLAAVAELPKKTKTAPAPPAEVTEEQAAEVLKDVLKSPEDFIELLPAEMREQMVSGLALHTKVRARMVKGILEQSGEVYTQDELESKSMADLEKLAKAINASVQDYTLTGDPPQTNVSEEELLLPVGVETT